MHGGCFTARSTGWSLHPPRTTLRHCTPAGGFFLPLATQHKPLEPPTAREGAVGAEKDRLSGTATAPPTNAYLTRAYVCAKLRPRTRPRAAPRPLLAPHVHHPHPSGLPGNPYHPSTPVPPHVGRIHGPFDAILCSTPTPLCAQFESYVLVMSLTSEGYVCMCPCVCVCVSGAPPPRG